MPTHLSYKYICNSCLAWFLRCMGFVPRGGCMYFRGRSSREVHTARAQYYPVKTMKQLTCTDRLYKANHQISFGARMSIL